MFVRDPNESLGEWVKRAREYWSKHTIRKTDLITYESWLAVQVMCGGCFGIFEGYDSNLEGYQEWQERCAESAKYREGGNYAKTLTVGEFAEDILRAESDMLYMAEGDKENWNNAKARLDKMLVD